MPTAPGGAAPFKTWLADDWPDLRSIWSDLNSKESEPPKFRSRELVQRQAGWVFERLVLEAFRLDGVTGHYPYRSSAREEDDGLILHGWQGFLVESKFKVKPVKIDPIYRLHALVGQRPVGTLGLFFSASGYTRGAARASEFLKPIRVLMFQPVDLVWALQAPGRMMAMVRRKWAIALKYGEPHPPIAQIASSDEGFLPEVIPLEFFGGMLDDTDSSTGPVAGGEPPRASPPGGDLPR